MIDLSDRLSNSESELPDFGALVEKVGVSEAQTLSQRSDRHHGMRPNQRRAARKVVQDDSDDE